MKFVSKQSNYTVVLKHGQPPEPLTGRVAVSGLYVKFENGMATIDDKEMIELMLKHIGFNRDFILLEDGMGEDPWSDFRRESEPEHTHTEINYGHVGKTSGSPSPTLSPDKKRELKKMAEGMAVEMAKEMAPKIAMKMLEEIAKNKEEELEKKNQAEVEKGGVPKPGTAPMPIESEKSLPEEIKESEKSFEREGNEESPSINVNESETNKLSDKTQDSAENKTKKTTMTSKTTTKK